MKTPVQTFLFPLWIALALLPAMSAAELYRWTDTDGRVHFSDRAPVGEPLDRVERLPAPQFADPGIPSGHYSVTEQWQRLQQERLARQRQQWERAREARELALREREVAASERAADNVSATRSVGSVGWGVPVRPRHPHRPVRPTPHSGIWKPDHPAYRPPSRHRPHPPRRTGVVLGTRK